MTTVDFAAAGFRSRLRKILKDHPQLGQGRGADVAEWESTLGESMGAQERKTQQVGFRLSASLVERLDAYAADYSKRTGIETSRTRLAEGILRVALDAFDGLQEQGLPGDPATMGRLFAEALKALEAE